MIRDTVNEMSVLRKGELPSVRAPVTSGNTLQSLDIREYHPTRRTNADCRLFFLKVILRSHSVFQINC